MEDPLVWEEIKKGNEEAYVYLYNEYAPLLFNYGMHLTGGDEESVKDCLQDLFTDLWKRKENLYAVNSIKFYLLKILRNKISDNFTARQQLRKRNEIFREINPDFELVFPEESLMIHRSDEYEKREKIIQAIQNLTKRQKEAIFLKFYDNLSYPQVASIMALNVNSTYNLISKAMEVLKKQLSKAYGLLFMLINFLN